MKYIIFIFTIFLFTSCDDAQMVADIQKDTKVPVWVYNTDCDSTTLVHYINGERFSYVLDAKCEPIKIIEETNGYPTGMLFLFILGVVLGFCFGGIIVTHTY